MLYESLIGRLVREVDERAFYNDKVLVRRSAKAGDLKEKSTGRDAAA